MNERIKNTSKAGQKIARDAARYAYNHSWHVFNNIFEAYKKPSTNKIRAWNYCKSLCEEMNGYDLIISAAGCQSFSVVFKFREKETDRECYAYITRDYSRFCYAA